MYMYCMVRQILAYILYTTYCIGGWVCGRGNCSPNGCGSAGVVVAHLKGCGSAGGVVAHLKGCGSACGVIAHLMVVDLQACGVVAQLKGCGSVGGVVAHLKVVGLRAVSQLVAPHYR